jgi:hypothetical protein
LGVVTTDQPGPQVGEAAGTGTACFSITLAAALAGLLSCRVEWSGAAAPAFCVEGHPNANRPANTSPARLKNRQLICKRLLAADFTFIFVIPLS